MTSQRAYRALFCFFICFVCTHIFRGLARQSNAVLLGVERKARVTQLISTRQGPFKISDLPSRESKPPTASSFFFSFALESRVDIQPTGTSAIARILLAQLSLRKDKSRRLPFTPISIFAQGKQDVTIRLSERRRGLICSSHMATLHSAAARRRRR